MDLRKKNVFGKSAKNTLPKLGFRSCVGGAVDAAGIPSEIYLGLPPVLVLLEAVLIVAATFTLGVAVIRMRPDTARMIEIE